MEATAAALQKRPATDAGAPHQASGEPDFWAWWLTQGRNAAVSRNYRVSYIATAPDSAPKLLCMHVRIEKTRDSAPMCIEKNKENPQLDLWTKVVALAHSWLPSNFTAGMRKLRFCRFNACIAAPLLNANDKPDTPQQEFNLGTFPVKPGELSDGDCPGLAIAYIGISPMLEEEVKREVPNRVRRRPTSSAAQLSPQRADGPQQWWTAAELNLSASIAVNNTRSLRCRTYRSVPDGALRQLWRHRCYSSIAEYAGAHELGDAAAKEKMIEQLVALPRAQLRRLEGGNAKKREAFLRQQLQGYVCTQTHFPEKREHGDKGPSVPVTDEQRRKDLAREEDERNAKHAEKLVMEGLIGRASRSLVRLPQVSIDEATLVSKLAELHPDGEPARNMAPPAKPVYSASSFTPEQIYGAVKACCNGSAPGPDGWTFELLLEALEHSAFTGQLLHVLVDICNGHVSDRVASLLASSLLVGIPKGETPEDGIRPIALGTILLKVASTLANAKAKNKLHDRFKGTQFGCSCKGGAEHIVHTVRRFLRDGVDANGRRAPESRVIVTFDFSNAFNMPLRQAMWDAAKDIEELQGVFNVSYREAADLLISGTTQSLRSKRGARQGTVDGPVLFALTLQAAINEVAALPGVTVMAYLDDVTVMADDWRTAERAARVLRDATAKIGMRLNMKKCERLPASPLNVNINETEHPTLFPFKLCDGVIKLLGASIGRNNEAEAMHLWNRESARTEMFFRRLALRAGPQMFTVLRTCGVPKLQHAIRVHEPSVSQWLCQTFDARVVDVIQQWAYAAPFGPRQRIILSLPRSMGGMGLTCMELIAPAAYRASATASDGARRVASQAKLASLIYCGVYGKAVESDAVFARHLETQKLEGCDAGLSYYGTRVSADAYGALLRSVLLTSSRTANNRQLLCASAACKTKPFDPNIYWGPHVTSCVSAPGNLPSRRHNRIVDAARDLARLAHFSPDASEPRDLHTYKCPCSPSGTFSHADFLVHKQTCKQASSTAMRSSGPDIRFFRGAQTVVADVTVIEMGNAAVGDKTALELFKARCDAKHELYDKLCNEAGAKLEIWPVTSMGHLGSELVSFIGAVADATYNNKRRLCMAMSAFVAHQTAYARLICERAQGIAPPPAKREHGDLGAGLHAVELGDLRVLRPIISELGFSSEQFAAILSKALADARQLEQMEHAGRQRVSQQATEDRAVDDAPTAIVPPADVADQAAHRSVLDAIRVEAEGILVEQSLHERNIIVARASKLVRASATLAREFNETTHEIARNSTQDVIATVEAETRNFGIRANNIKAELACAQLQRDMIEERAAGLRDEIKAQAAELAEDRQASQQRLSDAEMARERAEARFQRKSEALQDSFMQGRQLVEGLEADRDRRKAQVEEARRTFQRISSHVPKPSFDLSRLSTRLSVTPHFSPIQRLSRSLSGSPAELSVIPQRNSFPPPNHQHQQQQQEEENELCVRQE